MPDYLPAGTYDLRIEQPGAVNEQPDLKVIVKAARRQAGPARAEVRELKPGLPMLFINGRPVYPYVYTPYSLLAAGRVQPEAARLTRGQFAICSFGTNLGWTGEGKYDFGHMDECALTILARDPKAYLLPRVDVSAPPWWCDGHEDQLTRYADGVGWVTDALGGTRHQSFASQLWQQGAEEGLRKLIAHVLASPYRDRVIGYQIGNGIYGEWHYWSPEHMPDTSAPMQGAFDQYLLRKHKQAPGWQIPGERERLESAGMFLDPAKQSRLIDYYQCYQQASSAALLRFCRAVKQAGGGRALAGAFYAYLPDLWWGSEGFQLSAAPVLDSPFIDFLASPHSYAGRYPGQDAGFRAYIGSIRAHGKLFFDEADDRTYLSHAREPFRFTPTPWGSVQLLRREFANALTHNVGLWYFSLEQQFFDSDLFAGEFRRMREIADAAVPFMQPRKPEIAVIADPQALLYVAHFKTGKDPLTFHMFNEQLREIAKAGASNDLYLLSDLCGGLVPEHRMYVFLNTYRMTPRERAAVRARCMRPGKSVVFLGPAGYSDGDAISPQNSSDLTGFEIAQAAGLVALTGKASSGGGILEGLPADYRFGLGKVMDPGLCITGGGECVARYPSGDGCSTAIGQQNGATVILCLTPVLPAAVLRNAARAAGCHIWLGSDDIAYAGAPFLAVHTATAGAKAIRLPVKQAVVDVFARRLISAGCSELNLRLPRHATSLYFLGAPSQARSFLRALAGPGASARNQRPRRSVVSGDAATHAATQRRK